MPLHRRKQRDNDSWIKNKIIVRFTIGQQVCVILVSVVSEFGVGEMSCWNICTYTSIICSSPSSYTWIRITWNVYQPWSRLKCFMPKTFYINFNIILMIYMATKDYAYLRVYCSCMQNTDRLFNFQEYCGFYSDQSMWVCISQFLQCY